MIWSNSSSPLAFFWQEHRKKQCQWKFEFGMTSYFKTPPMKNIFKCISINLPDFICIKLFMQMKSSTKCFNARKQTKPSRSKKTEVSLTHRHTQYKHSNSHTVHVLSDTELKRMQLTQSLPLNIYCGKSREDKPNWSMDLKVRKSAGSW